jgi:hypothetical protein
LKLSSFGREHVGAIVLPNNEVAPMKKKQQREPERCDLCGKPNPQTDDGYTTCCELTVLPGEQGYEEAKKEWEAR